MARGSNTGRGNYPAGRLSVSAETLRQGIKGIPKIKTPNKYMSENSYKTRLKKHEEGK
jgi:hypothetical protein